MSLHKYHQLCVILCVLTAHSIKADSAADSFMMIVVRALQSGINHVEQVAQCYEQDIYSTVEEVILLQSSQNENNYDVIEKKLDDAMRRNTEYYMQWYEALEELKQLKRMLKNICSHLINHINFSGSSNEGSWKLCEVKI